MHLVSGKSSLAKFLEIYKNNTLLKTCTEFFVMLNKNNDNHISCHLNICGKLKVFTSI